MAGSFQNVNKSPKIVPVPSLGPKNENRSQPQPPSPYVQPVQKMVPSSIIQQPQLQMSVPMHRYYKSDNGDHFYTTFWSEGFHQKLITQWNYAYEGVIGLIFKNPVTGTVPLHRYYNSQDGDHLYTTDWGELGGGRGGYKYEGTEGYVYQNATDGTVPLFRYYNPIVKDHFYTTNWKDMKDEGLGYKLDFIQAYIFPN